MVVRQRIVDDADPSIQYGSQGWFMADPTTLTGGNFGPIYNGTTHATKSNATLSYAFSGTSMSVYGTIAIVNNTGVVDPTWSCLVDGVAMSTSTFAFFENHWQLCSQDTLAVGSHVLDVQVHSSGTPFYVDFLAYTPLANDTFESAVLVYESTDEAVSFSSGWTDLGGENATQSAGASVALNFHGTSVTMRGYVPYQLAHNATWATYAIDDGAPVNFTLNGLRDNATEYNVVLFTTPELESAEHNLVVTYALRRLPRLRPSSTPAPTPSIAASASSHKGKPVGAIAGGVVGGILLLLAVFLALCFRRRRGRRRDEFALGASSTSFPMSIAPTVVGASDYKKQPPAGDAAYSYAPLRPNRGGAAGTDGSRPSTTTTTTATMTNPSVTMYGLESPSNSTPVSPHGGGSDDQQQQQQNDPTLARMQRKLAREGGGGFEASQSHDPIPQPAQSPAQPGQMDPNVTVSRVFVQHQDSGARSLDPQTFDLPPGYTPD
ncbi:hypothetical protein HMN09_00559800 [Mycena chlorophos]|uniref:Transmembrane protein n=1 Tax=Mycena chlorophos TaxID=658473 RepID=A0A8H6WGI1_MYCCL|nr:hypothetical protein HMN09_00559800 [Mycena chlorophos]